MDTTRGEGSGGSSGGGPGSGGDGALDAAADAPGGDAAGEAGATEAGNAPPDPCELLSCEMAAPDGCCPSLCNAENDADCSSVCGNELIEGEETCDPPGTCPLECPNRGCTAFKLEGLPETCTAKCVEAGPVSACRDGDGCCPTGCTSLNDKDCQATCGNNAKEGAELCDPPSGCPSACPAEGCQLRKLVNGGTCSAECIADRKQTRCVANDGCCPVGCNNNNDSDCAPRCKNGIKEEGEACDPCPAACPAQACQLMKLENAGTCNARCVPDRLQTQCRPGDGCCPAGCNDNNDADCNAVCGNKVKEGGELCDPCATNCPAVKCQLMKLENPGTCNARCVNDRLQTECRAGDGCCPTACNETNDVDCMAVCGNRAKERGELCDPCPTTCPAMGCQLRKLATPGTCNAQCVNDRLQAQCRNADGCCPTGCNSTNDSDCTATCGNKVKEGGELCDPCPTACPAMGCQLQRLENPGTCNARCVNAGTQTQCRGGDGCCPAGCNSTNDGECVATCGNGVKEGNELCDGADCPTAARCTPVNCRKRKLSGANCQRTCIDDGPICQSGDGCCGQGCNATNDGDCGAVCGNGVKEGNELCDGADCPTAAKCTPVNCRKRKVGGANCQRTCVDDGGLCQSGDGCCGQGCTPANDRDCGPRCGDSDGQCPPGCTNDPDCRSPDAGSAAPGPPPESGPCGLFFEDKDGDGFGVGAQKRVCGSSRPPGYATRGGDCCDTSDFVFPGQTSTSHFSPSYCNSADVNCDGVETMFSESAWDETNDCSNGRTPIGWRGGVPQTCRQTGTLVYCRNRMEVAEANRYPGCY